MTKGKSTFAKVDQLKYRLKAAATLLGVTINTLRGYTETSEVQVARATDLDSTAAVAARIFTPENVFEIAAWRRSQGYLKVQPPTDAGPVIVTVYVVKGGTGKTTTAVETAIHLQLSGLKVLCIDLDVQSNMTQAMGYESDISEEECSQYDVNKDALIDHTFADLLVPYLNAKRGERQGNAKQPKLKLPVGLIKKPFGEAGPHLIGSDTFLGDVEMAIAASFGARELAINGLLKAALDGEIADFNLKDYDVVMFDCSPSVSLTSTAALACADLVVAPIRMDSFAVKGLTRLINEVKGLKDTYKVNPELVILPTHYAPQIKRINRMQHQLTQYSSMLAPNAISQSEEFPKSLDNYLPLTLQKPSITPVQEYAVFAQFLREKIQEHAALKSEGMQAKES